MDLRETAAVLSDAQQLAAAATKDLAAAYRAVFDGAPTADDQAMVLRDLEIFCGMRTSMLRATFHETAEQAGKFRVFQRIHAFRFPLGARPADAAPQPGETDGQRPEPGRGIAEQTQD